jgi:hypothetical protein
MRNTISFVDSKICVYGCYAAFVDSLESSGAHNLLRLLA